MVNPSITKNRMKWYGPRSCRCVSAPPPLSQQTLSFLKAVAVSLPYGCSEISALRYSAHFRDWVGSSFTTMGCVSSKRIRCDSPLYEDVRPVSCLGGSQHRRSNILKEELELVKAEADEDSDRNKRCDRQDTSSRRQSQGELVAAGWPVWLTAVASEAIDGWVPLRADAYERLDKVQKHLSSTSNSYSIFKSLVSCGVSILLDWARDV